MIRVLAQMGKRPFGKRLEKLKQSQNYKHGQFHNKSVTSQLTQGVSLLKAMSDIIVNRPKRKRPVQALPTMKVDLLNLDKSEDILVWFGHSSYFMQIASKNFLVDPVLSGNASPIRSSVCAFQGTDIYDVNDIPEIDLLFITHDHYDHMDYHTLKALKPKIKKIICGLGVGEHLEYWGYDPKVIVETDWDERVDLGDGLVVHTTTARHFSGRNFFLNNTLWQSYVLETPYLKLFLGGDSGYDSHFTQIGKKFGPFDLVILENGQYNQNRAYIHMTPEQVLQAAKDLGAKRLLPVHSSKFALSTHDRDAPLKTISELNSGNMQLVTPMIGQAVYLKNTRQQFVEWRKERE